MLCMDGHEELLRTAKRLREQCKAERGKATRLRKEAGKTMAVAARAMKRALRLYEGEGRS